MPALTISAVDATANTLTVTGHGQVTGNGPAAVRSVGGSLPSPLTAVTDFWLIVDGPNTLRLATSSANAMAGTAVDLTTAGSGTLLLEIGIPYRRPRTYAPLSQLKSADLNAIQDSLTAIYDLLTAQTQAIFTGVSLAVPLEAAHGDRVLPLSAYAIVATANNAYNNAPVSWTPSGASTGYLNIPLPTGNRAKSVTFARKGDGAVDITADVYVTTAAGATTPIGNVTLTNPAASWNDTTIDITDTTLAAGESLSMVFTTNAANGQIGNIRVTHDRPNP